MTKKPNINTCTHSELIVWAKKTGYLNLKAWAETTMRSDREYTDDEIYYAWADGCIGEGQIMSASL